MFTVKTVELFVIIFTCRHTSIHCIYPHGSM